MWRRPLLRRDDSGSCLPNARERRPIVHGRSTVCVGPLRERRLLRYRVRRGLLFLPRRRYGPLDERYLRSGEDGDGSEGCVLGIGLRESMVRRLGRMQLQTRWNAMRRRVVHERQPVAKRVRRVPPVRCWEHAVPQSSRVLRHERVRRSVRLQRRATECDERRLQRRLPLRHGSDDAYLYQREEDDGCRLRERIRMRWGKLQRRRLQLT